MAIPVVTSESLERQALQKLLDGEILAIRVPRYLDPEACQEIAQKLLHKKYQYYEYAEEVVGRYGYSFSEIGKNQASHERYYAESTPSIRSIRSIFAPYLSPVDKLRLELEEIWPKGALQEELHEGKKMFVGLCRVIEPNKDVLPHQDVIAWDANYSEKALEIKKQLTVNVYLQVPEEGGELELWDFGIADEKEYKNMGDGKSYGVPKSKLPAPSAALKPEPGELIMFNPHYLHCIRRGIRKRITMSCFIGYRGEENPITYWS